jgi:hypothetical protein
MKLSPSKFEIESTTRPTPRHKRAAAQALSACVVRLVHPLPMNGNLFMSTLSLGLQDAICNHPSVVDAGVCLDI